MRNVKLVRQARLPKGAFAKDLSEAIAPFEVKQWCKKHPLSYWGKGYLQCVEGKRRNEECERGS